MRCTELEIRFEMEKQLAFDENYHEGGDIDQHSLAANTCSVLNDFDASFILPQVYIDVSTQIIVEIDELKTDNRETDFDIFRTYGLHYFKLMTIDEAIDA